jgi:hypothetical protein
MRRALPFALAAILTTFVVSLFASAALAEASPKTIEDADV